MIGGDSLGINTHSVFENAQGERGVEREIEDGMRKSPVGI
jgi:hypothetical protein